MSNAIRIDIIENFPVRIKDLFQWDTGQVLEIHGSNLSGTIEGRFSVNGMEPTSDQQGTITDGVAKIAIPDGVLEKSGKLKVYIRKTDKSSATTEYVAVGMIRKAEKPSGNAESALSLQNKTITPSKKIQSVTADSGYDALGKVTVNAIPSDYIQPSGEKEITANGTFDVESYASAKVNVSSSGTDTSDTLTVASENKLGGVKPVAKTDAMTEPVGVDSEGRLFTKPVIDLSWIIVDENTDLSSLDFVENSIIYFRKGTYHVSSSINIYEIPNIVFLLHEAVINCTAEYFIAAAKCDDIRVLGGKNTGASQCAVKLQDCKRAVVRFVEIANVGSKETENSTAIQIFGDCTGFQVDHNYIHDIRSGVISSDGFVHAYGVFVNRLGSTNTYSKSGVICDNVIDNIAGIDSENVKADGDGIFIQNPPYLDGDTVVWCEPDIIVERNILNNCKKRGVKAASDGVTVRHCKFDGDFWYAAVDLQYGHGKVHDCNIRNTSNYNGSVTSGIVASDGGIEVKGNTIRCPYTSDDGTETYHPGVRLSERLGSSIIDQSVTWDKCVIDDNYFDQVSRAVFASTSKEDAPTYALDGLEILNCRFGKTNKSHVVDISSTVFSSIGTFRMIDFRFDAGTTRSEVKAANSAFTYPAGISVDPTCAFELYSRYWASEPMSGYDGLPTSPNTKIVYAGDISGIRYKEYTSHGSIIYGTRVPSEVTATLALQLLYNSKIGDRYINVANGTMYVCTEAGTSNSIGTWNPVSVEHILMNKY